MTFVGMLGDTMHKWYLYETTDPTSRHARDRSNSRRRQARMDAQRNRSRSSSRHRAEGDNLSHWQWNADNWQWSDNLVWSSSRWTDNMWYDHLSTGPPGHSDNIHDNLPRRSPFSPPRQPVPADRPRRPRTRVELTPPSPRSQQVNYDHIATPTGPHPRDGETSVAESITEISFHSHDKQIKIRIIRIR